MGQALPNLKIIIMLVCWFSHLLCYSVVKYYVHRIETLSSSASMAVRPLQKSEFFHVTLALCLKKKAGLLHCMLLAVKVWLKNARAEGGLDNRCG
jgi:hypothetical protein